MRKLATLFVFTIVFISYSFSQNNVIVFKMLGTDGGPAGECDIYVDGKIMGNSKENGVYYFQYDTSTNNYTIEVKNTFEKISKKFTVSTKGGTHNLKSDYIGFNQLGAYLNIDKTKKSIPEMFDYFQSAGVTDLFVPVFYDGKTIYPSKVKNINASSRDYLKEITNEGVKRSIRIHAVINTLNWGSGNIADFKFKDYLSLNRSGKYDTGIEGKDFFVSPASQEANQLLVDITRELAINYRNLTGISLDYLRYKKGIAANYITDDYGFEKSSVEMFKNLHKIDPAKIKPDTTIGSDWLKWIEHKENLILNLAVKMIAAAKDTNAALKITISADPNYVYRHGKDLTCENYYEIGEFTRIDYFLMKIDKDNYVADLKAAEPFITKTLPMIEGSIGDDAKFDDILKYLKDNKFDYFFGLYDQTVFESANSNQKMLNIIFR